MKVNPTIAILGIITVVALICHDGSTAVILWIGYGIYKLITTDW